MVSLQADPVFMQFFLSIVFDGLEQKYSVVLDRGKTLVYGYQCGSFRLIRYFSLH
jgi:hypothetical protein